MTGDKSLFVKYESKEGGDVTFGDNAKWKIKGFGSIGNNKTSIHNVLFVDGLKHNLLSIKMKRTLLFLRLEVIMKKNLKIICLKIFVMKMVLYMSSPLLEHLNKIGSLKGKIERYKKCVEHF
ncbi:hypothetical protein CFOL_v3_17425 [Cephalotus follicularis]|uniref:Retrovirus-related Pol polyprotein from transposon TNT 1-94-like beta-barrel domain-containing protein n=1 Tax=Cephalotus follicularis TaxID=3775 RepID=A0A1Q3C1F1_CEPFO|nr:hypothetical protein CFOL_v3_17425 [Cephalotus follicularis]